MAAHTEQAATPIAFVSAIVLGYEKYGVDPEAALRRAQIAPALLRRPGAKITASQMEAISDAAMRELDDEALGWFSRRLPWGSYGMLCRASITAPTLGIALARWCRHHRLLVDDIALQFSESAGVASITISEHRDLGAMREFCLLTSLRYMHAYACWAIDSRVTCTQVEFPFVAPPHAPAYALMFPGPVSFGAAQTSLRFDAAYLAQRLRRDERALQTMLQRALPLTVRQYRRDRLLVQRVRDVLRLDAAAALTASTLADRLHLSVRSLHRQLQEEGATLQSLKDEVRRDLALELIQRTTTPIKQVAGRVGFRNDKSFARAFKQWTGMTPGAARADAG